VGAVALAAGWVARTSAPQTRVAAIFPDGPQRYFDTIYNDDYCAAHGLLDAAPPTGPVTIEDPSSSVVSSWTRCTRVVDPTGRVS
jgi:cysteine synthase A